MSRAVKMHRASKLLFLIGMFLAISVLWPYEARTEPVGGSSTRFFAFSPIVAEAVPTLPMRDDWGGETRLAVSDATLNLPGAAQQLAGPQPTRIPIPSGARVLPGTSRILVTSESTSFDGNNAPVIKLATLAANDRWRQTTLDPQGTTVLTVSEDMNDWSPDPNTRWRFELYNLHSSPVSIHVRVEILRPDGPLVDQVVYDDGWGDRDVKVLYAARSQLMDARVVEGYTAYTSSPSAQPRLRGPPPRDIEELRVVFVYNSSTPSDLHYRPALAWRGADKDADRWEAQGVPPTVAIRQSQNGRFEWRLPVEPRMWDSPFALDTRWDILVNWRGGDTENPAAMRGDFHFRVEVHQAP